MESELEAVIRCPAVMSQKPIVFGPQNRYRLLVPSSRQNGVYGRLRAHRHVQPVQPPAHLPAGFIHAVDRSLPCGFHQPVIGRLCPARHPRQRPVQPSAADLLSYGFGLEASRGGLYRAPARMASRAEPTYDGLVETARQAPVNGMDETGWKVGGRLHWLHVAVSAQATVYAILPGRGYEQSVAILGAEYDGFLTHDGWAPYYRFQFAFHQSCLVHLLKRCREMAQIASPAALAFPQTVEDLLETSLELRDRYAQGEISERGLSIATGKLEAKLDRMLEARRRNPANRRLARHLEHERLWLFTFLHCPGLDATNNVAERAIRGMVIARKVWGGNRTWKGAHTHQVLAS